jgi:hypothetical protein
MLIRYEVSSYNTRRYSKPWIAKIVSWQSGKLPDLEFGVAIDDTTAEIEAQPGSLVRFGQKDYRNPRNTIAAYAVVSDQGKLNELSASKAHDWYITNQAA